MNSYLLNRQTLCVIPASRNWPYHLYTRGKLEQQASELILQVAQTLHEQGRDATLREWVLKLPEAMIAGSGWIQYWLGQTYMAIDPLKALDCFEKAYQLFADSNEIDGQYRAISGGCRSLYISQRVQTGQDIWIQRFVMLDKQYPLTSINTDTADILANVLIAMHWRDPTNEAMLRYLVEAERIWAETDDIDKRLNLGVSITCIFAGLGRMQEGISMLQQQQILAERHPWISLSVLWHYMYVGFFNCFAGRLEESQTAIERVLELGEESGIHVVDLLALAVGTYNQLLLGRLGQADHYLDRMQRILVSLPLNLDAAHYHALRGWRCLCEGDNQTALRESQKAVEIAGTIGAKYPLSLCKYGLAHAHIANGDYDQAQVLLEKAHCPFGEGTYRRLDYEIALTEAYIAILTGNRQRTIEKIKQGMQIAIEDGYGPPLWGYPGFLRAVFGLALEEQIEVAYVQKLIRIAQLSPSAKTLHLDNWPFPLKVYTLGRFSILKEDQALKFKGKAQKRPLGLLKALIAFGGRKVAEEKLNQALWPDTDGDTAHQSFTTTLHRLRGLIGNEVVVLQESCLSLDPRYVWVDTWVFERLLTQIDQAIEQQTDTEQIQHDLNKAMALYQGHFLEKESEDPWALSQRERLRSRWLRTMKNSICYLGHQGHCSLAIDLYQKALELDDLAEELYRGLMGCYATQGQYAEALSVYGKCHKILSTVLGIDPSEATEHLYQAIQTKDKAVLSHVCDGCK